LIEKKKAEMNRVRREIETLLETNHVASVQLETERLTVNKATLQLEATRLDADIARARARQTSLESKLALKQRILSGTAATGTTVAAAGPANPPLTVGPVEHIQPDDFRKLSSEQLFEGVDLASLIAKREALQSSLDSVNDRLLRLPEVQTRLDALRVALTSVERDYSLLNDSYQEAAVRATSPVSEVRVMHPAVVPTGPVAPIKVYHVLLAGALALLLAVGLVYLLSFLGISIFFAPPAKDADGPEPGAAPAQPAERKEPAIHD